jgi:hypothetical protein
MAKDNNVPATLADWAVLEWIAAIELFLEGVATVAELDEYTVQAADELRVGP